MAVLAKVGPTTRRFLASLKVKRRTRSCAVLVFAQGKVRLRADHTDDVVCLFQDRVRDRAGAIGAFA